MHRLRPHSRGFTLLLGALTTLASFATDMGLARARRDGRLARRSGGARRAVPERVHGRLRARAARVRARLRSRRSTPCAAHRCGDVHRVRRVRRVHALARRSAALALAHGRRARAACSVLVVAMVRDLFTRHRGARAAIVRESRGGRRADHRAHTRRCRRDAGRMARHLWIPRGGRRGAVDRGDAATSDESLRSDRVGRSRCSARSAVMRASSGIG